MTIADFVADARASTPSNAAEIAVPDQKELRHRLAVLQSRMTQSETARVQYQRKRWQELSHKRVMLDPMAFIADKRMLLDYTQTRLSALAQQQTAARKQRFGRLCASLDALSPLKVLSRGYAVARDERGAVVKNAADVDIGERIDVALGQGSLLCRVENRNLGGNDDGKNI